VARKWSEIRKVYNVTLVCSEIWKVYATWKVGSLSQAHEANGTFQIGRTKPNGITIYTLISD
jgi:hypothetical protein